MEINNKKYDNSKLTIKIIKKPRERLAKIVVKKENLSLKNSQLEMPTTKPTKANNKFSGKKITAPNIIATITRALINLSISIIYTENLKFLHTFYFFWRIHQELFEIGLRRNLAKEYLGSKVQNKQVAIIGNC